MLKSFHAVGVLLFAAMLGIVGTHLGLKLTAYSKPSARLPLPSAGKTYTVKQLFDLINMNNPAQTSNFIVPIDASGRPIKDANCGRTAIAGSKSVSNAGLLVIIQGNMSTSVELKDDAAVIQVLYKKGVLDSTTQQQYARLLLYFVIDGYRFYINDPFPPKIVVGRVNPVANIISKWDFKKSY